MSTNYRVHYSYGNSKTGKGVLIFNMKTGDTCSPEACKTCYLTGCYARNEEVRFPVIAHNDYEDYFLAKYKPTTYFEQVRFIIQEHYNKGCRHVRLHERGDFFCAEYMREWISVSDKFPDVMFWGYTKQWEAVIGNMHELNRKRNGNFILYASKWTGIDIPPMVSSILPIAYYGDVEENIPEKGVFVCPSSVINPKTGTHFTCKDCGLCTKCAATNQGVCFKAHGSKALSIQKKKLKSNVKVMLQPKYMANDLLKYVA